MPSFHHDNLADLARQLTYSPADKRTAQLSAATALAQQIDPNKSYPWEFVHFRITGYRPNTTPDAQAVLTGSTLRADLASLIEILSDTLSISSTASPEPILSLEDVCRQFDVSSKTIQRWRKQGLLAQRYIFPDGRRRLGFSPSAVEVFAKNNTQRIQDASHFRQVNEAERELILRQARRLADKCHCCLKEITQRLSRKLHRSPETIRYTIRNYDLAHPETAIFPDLGAPIREVDRKMILDYFNRGMPVHTIARRYCRTRSSIYRLVTQQKAEELKLAPIEFVPNPLFEHPDADSILLEILPRQAQEQAREQARNDGEESLADMGLSRTPAGLPSYLAELFRQPPLVPVMETDAFRRMNYLKFKAHGLRERLDPENATSSALAEIESLLHQAASLKNQLVQANLRIAVHVARKHFYPVRASNRFGAGGKGGGDLMELVSDATIWVMRAVDRFDFSRGVKFSTYASYAIMKNFARDRVEQIARPDRRMVTGQEELLDATGSEESVTIPEHLDKLAATSDLVRAIQKLPPRERELLTAHYGLDPTSPPMSLAQLGEKLGITKSRVRQLETRALRKLRQLLETSPSEVHPPA